MKLCMSLAVCLLMVLALTMPTTGKCPINWTKRGHSCYEAFKDAKYWYVAEQQCISHGGNLVSIRSELENNFVARLAQCKDAWIGRFGTELNNLKNPSVYEWTDKSLTSFHLHNFTMTDSVHKPLIRIGPNGKSWLNSLYHEKYPYVCEANDTSESTADDKKCEYGWSYFQNFCYKMPDFKLNFIEATYYCQNNSAHVTSMRSKIDAQYIKNLIFGADGCHSGNASIDTTWIGLIKMNPCIPDIQTNKELCYQWTDLQGKWNGLPAWNTNSDDDWTVNCVTFAGDKIQSEKCHKRHHFVCKKNSK